MVLGVKGVSGLERCPQFRGVFIDGFDCIHRLYLEWNADNTRSVCRSGTETGGGVSHTISHSD